MRFMDDGEIRVAKSAKHLTKCKTALLKSTVLELIFDMSVVTGILTRALNWINRYKKTQIKAELTMIPARCKRK